MAVLTVVLLPFLFYTYLPVLVKFFVFAADLFLDIDQEFFLSFQDTLTSALFPGIGIGVVIWLVILIPFTVLVFYLFFFVYRKIAQFSYVTASIILLLIAATCALSPLSLFMAYEIVQKPSVFWIFVFAGGIIMFPVGWLIVRGLVVILKHRKSPVQELFERGGSPSFFLGFRRLTEELYKATGVVFPPTGSTANTKVLSACLFAITCEGLAYGVYLKTGDKLIGNAALFAGPADIIGITGTIGGYTAFVVFILTLNFVFARFFFWVSRRLRSYALRRSVVLADEACHRDSRPPVLFLRTFRDDQVSLLEAHTSKIVRFFDPDVDLGTLEQLVVMNLIHQGPVIGLGNPADKLPPIGAAREYIRKGDWQAVIESLMEKSARIVLALEFSRNLQWEVETIRNKKLLQKTITLIPPQLSSNRQALDKIFNLLGIRDENKMIYQLDSKLTSGKYEVLQHSSDLLSSFSRYLIGVVWQNENTPVVMTSDRLTELDYELALRMGIHKENLFNVSVN
jgi:hypothetical protein